MIFLLSDQLSLGVVRQIYSRLICFCEKRACRRVFYSGSAVFQVLYSWLFRIYGRRWCDSAFLPFAISDEAYQLFVIIGRKSSDIVIDAFGIFLAYFLSIIFRGGTERKIGDFCRHKEFSGTLLSFPE